MEWFLDDHKDYPSQHWNKQNHWGGKEHPTLIFYGQTKIIRIIGKNIRISKNINRGNSVTKLILDSEVENKSKRAGLRITVNDSRRRVTRLSKVGWDKELITENNRSFSSTIIGSVVQRMVIEVIKDNYDSRGVNWDNLNYVRWNSIRNCKKKRTVTDTGKKSKIMRWSQSKT